MVKKLVWKDEYSVGVPIFDTQHKRLFELINDLIAAKETGESDDLLREALDALVDYVGQHFATEEELMAKHGYADGEAHREQHAVFVRKTLQFHRKLRAKEQALSEEVLDYLQGWWVQHIMHTDMRYKEFFQSQSIT